MKKLALAAMVSALGMTAGIANAAPSGTPSVPEHAKGTVHFHGKVLTNSCKVSSDSKNLHVTLPVVMDRQVQRNHTIGETPFRIKVSECPSYGHMAPKLAWDVSNHDSNRNGDLVNNNRNGFDNNVALRLIDNDNRRVNLRDSNYRANSIERHGDNRTYQFRVGYIQGDKNAPVRPGIVKAQAKYVITYQ